MRLTEHFKLSEFTKSGAASKYGINNSLNPNNSKDAKIISNLKALCDSWDKEEIGVAYNYLKNYGIDEENPYIGKKCIIRKGTIVTSPHSK